MLHIIRYLALGILAVLGDILINLVADSVHVPRDFYYAPMMALAIVVIVSAMLDSKRDVPWHGTMHGPRRVKDVDSTSGAILRGRRMRIRYAKGIAFGCYCFAIFTLVLTSGYFAGSDRRVFGISEPNQLAGSIFGSITVTLVGVAVISLVGFKAWLGFTDSGLTIRDNRGRYFIKWDDALVIDTQSTWGSTYLVAKLPPKSHHYFSGPWEMHPKHDDVIRLCNLKTLGIPRHAVDGALEIYEF